MQFYNASDAETSLYADCLYWSGADSTTYPIDPDFTRNANLALDRVTGLILRTDNSWKWDDTNATSSQLITTSAVSATRNVAITASWLKILRVRVLDTAGQYHTLDAVTRDQFSDSDLATTNTGVPTRYAKVGNLIILDKVYTGTIEIQFQRASADYFTPSDTTQEPGFAPQFHRLISLYAALDYTEPNELEGRSRTIRNRIQSLEGELIDHYSQRDADQVHSLRMRKEDYGDSALGETKSLHGFYY